MEININKERGKERKKTDDSVSQQTESTMFLVGC
jgi:hypothetical protein